MTRAGHVLVSRLIGNWLLGVGAGARLLTGTKEIFQEYFASS